MRVLDVKPAGFRVLVEYDLIELEKLLDALDRAQIDPKDQVNGSVDYVVNEFYPKLKSFLESLKNGS
jgi:hypothetical protein